MEHAETEGPKNSEEANERIDDLRRRLQAQEKLIESECGMEHAAELTLASGRAAAAMWRGKLEHHRLEIKRRKAEARLLKEMLRKAIDGAIAIETEAPRKAIDDDGIEARLEEVARVAHPARVVEVALSISKKDPAFRKELLDAVAKWMGPTRPPTEGAADFGPPGEAPRWKLTKISPAGRPSAKPKKKPRRK
jgi:hypothetical protein